MGIQKKKTTSILICSILAFCLIARNDFAQSTESGASSSGTKEFHDSSSASTVIREDPETFGVAKSIRAEIQEDKESVKISWTPPEETGEIIIARSSSVIDTPEKCFKADSLGKFPSGVSGGINHIYDYNLAPGTYYYAVILAHHVRNKTLKMVAGQNYTPEAVTIEPPDEKDKDEAAALRDDAQVQNIQLSKEGNSMRINWDPYPDAKSGRTVYTIYRSDSPMSSISLMTQAEKLAEVSHPAKTFLDQGLTKSRTVYYGVSVRSGSKEILPLIPDQSFARFFFIYNQTGRNSQQSEAQAIADSSGPSPDEIRSGKENVPIGPSGQGFSYSQMHVSNLMFEKADNGIILDWKAPTQPDSNVEYSIYEAAKPLDGGIATFLTGSVSKLGTLKHPDTRVLIRLKDYDTDRYFGVVVSRNGKSDFNLKKNESWIQLEKQSAVNTEKPAAAQPTESDRAAVQKPAQSEQLELILKKYYFRSHYKQSVKLLSSLISELDQNSEILGKAKFYLGLSLYQEKRYTEALKILLSPEAKNYDQKRARFWAKNCLEKIAEGKK